MHFQFNSVQNSINFSPQSFFLVWNLWMMNLSEWSCCCICHCMPFPFCGPAFSTPSAFVYVWDFFGSLFHLVRDKRECNERNENRRESSSICIQNLCLHKLFLLIRNGEMNLASYSCITDSVFALFVVWHVYGIRRKEKKRATISTIRCSNETNPV